MPEIKIATKKSVTLRNDEHDPITFNGLHEFLNAAADLNLHSDTIVEFRVNVYGGTAVIESMSLTENAEKRK